MGDGFAALDAHIERVRAIGELPVRAAPAVADGVLEVIEDALGAQQDPYGKPWPKTKDGTPALQNADKALQVRPVGNAVVATLTGPEARHNNGWVKGGVQRRILPKNGEIPDAWGEAITDAVGTEFRETMGVE